MSASSLKTTLLAVLIATGLASRAAAQVDCACSPFYCPSNDMRFFEPVDLDLDCRGCDCHCGFYFNYDKLAWATTGERFQVGDPDTVQRSFGAWGGVPLDPETGDPIVPPLIRNSIQSAVPRAVFDTGDRYEFGYWSEDGKGWQMSVLNGPDNIQGMNLGLFQTVRGTATNPDNDDDDDPDLPINDGNPLDDDGPPYSPLGSVFVSFRTDPGFLAGFLDIDEGEIGSDVLDDDDVGDGWLDGNNEADDRNNNGQHGAQGFDTDGDGEVDTIIFVPPDYGDLVTLTTDYNIVTTRNTLKINGFELMRSYRLSNDHFLVRNQNNHFEVSFGARYLQFKDDFLFEGQDGFIMGDGRWDTLIVNNIVGPQVGFDWKHVLGRWTLQTDGKFMCGYNIQDWSQDGYIMEGAVPGRNNHPLYARGYSFSYGRNEDDFSPVGELRLNAKYRLTDNINLKLGWTGTYAGAVRRASTSVDYALFEDGNVMGFRTDGEQNLFTNGVNVGVEIRQ
ncbi:BBP7 family outer membrane beta-barrel protein [Aeoliella sp. ICT_H6.2]|uniref:BBP7 family outer membrane beta-barrel protein n=1 Tax=Aeoliella straminimaris TaxID=2954799 RepID=A0A9X2FIR8_9BACT|nr:BBP7 family outer membrane beta-barrel protein [Aeoliella straminimaris]MCO6046321.1 BBP7 family outer membrane beta-barrel protein [Aeoliella straminimaris]